MTRQLAILIVEDDPIARNMLSNIFRGEGYYVTEAEDGTTGLELALKEFPDLICLDVVLPGLSGYEVCRKIRRHPRGANIPILMVTALNSREDIIKGLRSGATDYITKPFSHPEVLARAKVCIDQRLLLEGLERKTEQFRLAWEILEATTSTLDLRQVLYTMVSRAAAALRASRSSIIVIEGSDHGAGTQLTGRVMVSADDPNLTDITLDLGKYPEILKAFKTGEYVLVQDIQTDPLMAEVREKVTELGNQAVLAVPLTFRGEVLGAFLLRSSRDGEPFTDEEVTMARIIAGASTNALRNASLFNRLERKNTKLEKLNSDLEKANRELSELSRMKSDFVSMVSHELRTPLTSIIGFSELLADEHVGQVSEEQAQYIRMILQKSKDLLYLINDLLDTGKLESGRMSIRIKEVRLNTILSAVISSTRHVTDAQPVINPDIPEDLPAVEIDPEKITQALTNLVTNALKFSPPGSPVDIKARIIRGRRDGDHSELLQISVCDQGQGIEEDYREKIFDRFFQVDQGPGRTHRGAGLGLYITRSFVELHGGRIWVENNVGQGSTFHLTLPIRQE